MGKERISGECPYCRASLATDRDKLRIQKEGAMIMISVMQA